MSTATSGALDITHTSTGVALGTPAYMAPEQHDGGTIDARADQFALAVVLYEALAGRRPFRGKTMAELRARVLGGHADPLPAGAAPARIARAIARGLARDPADRFPSMDAMLAAIAPPRRARWIVGASAILALAGGAAAVTTAVRDHAIHPAPACEASAHSIDAMWTDDARTKEARDHGDVAWIDDYARRWSTARWSVCAAGARAPEPAAACLDAARDALPHALAREAGAWAPLTSIASCLRPAPHVTTLPGAIDPLGWGSAQLSPDGKQVVISNQARVVRANVTADATALDATSIAPS
jgi:hypothetical protein